MFNHSLVEISSRTLIPLFTSGSDHIGKIQCVKFNFFFLTCLTANIKDVHLTDLHASEINAAIRQRRQQQHPVLVSSD